ncbi:MAG: HAD hydrolase-like protein [Candidatus Dormibacteraeota bacterium]|nr:HAD hydrolase-like protein [Candidatus Dormibacteraeota bacterium]
MRSGATLLIDGDDTLWENNVYFEEAIEAFLDYLRHSSLSRSQVRATLDEVERLNSGVHGYGTAAFARNLRQTYERLAERKVEPRDLDYLMTLGQRILRRDIELLPAVGETLAYLEDRHRLLLLTKGDAEEQRLKVDRSGLAAHFADVVIVREKDINAYRDLVVAYRLEPTRTWMVGNSPRSDINPALAAGLHAVFIPHPHTWRLEHEAIPPANDRLLVLETFAELRAHF